MVTRVPAPTDTETGNALAPGAADLEAVAQRFEQLEADSGPAEVVIAAESQATGAELMPLLKMARTAGAPSFAWWPDYAETWSDAQLKAIADAGAECLNHYGMGVADLIGHPLFRLAVATVPPAVMTWGAVRQRKAELAAAERARRAAPAAQ